MGTTTPVKLGFIRAPLSLWAGDIFQGRAGAVTDAPTNSGATETWGWHDGTQWRYAARRGGNEVFGLTTVSSLFGGASGEVSLGGSWGLWGAGTTASMYATDYYTGTKASPVQRISSVGAGFFTALSVSGLTNGKLPRVSSGSGLFTDSCFGDDGTNATCTRPLTLNGATRPAWHGNFIRTLQTGPVTALAVYDDGSSGDSQEVWVNCYYDGAYKAVSARTGNYPVRLSVGAGTLALVTSVTQPVAGGVISDMSTKWRVSKEGGCGFFGVSAPTTRPTVNAACTDLTTCITLTNQLRTHLIACGLVQ